MKTINLETYRKNGEPVQTPVWLVERNGTVYVRTDPGTWKTRRIRNNSAVRIAESNMNGKILGPWLKGEARFANDVEAKEVLELFKKKYGVLGRTSDFFNKVRGRKISTIIAIKIKE